MERETIWLVVILGGSGDAVRAYGRYEDREMALRIAAREGGFVVKSLRPG